MNFEEGTLGAEADTVYDQSTYGNHGQAQDPWSYGKPRYVASHDSSQALLFGYDSTMTTAGGGWNCIGINKSVSLANLGTQWSMGGWIRVDSVEGYYDDTLGYYGRYPRMIECPSYEITMHSPSDGVSYFWPWDQDPAYPDASSWDFAMADTSGYEGTWMHMICSYDGTTFTQYINGVSVFTRTGFDHQFGTEYGVGVWNEDFGGGEPWWTDAPLLLGANLSGYPAGSGWLIGAMDDIAIWGGTGQYIDPAYIQDLYNGVYTPATVPTIPEPMTLSLLGLGGLALRRRRK
jgi:hypothetical protein